MMKIFKYIFAAIGIGIIAYCFRDVLIAGTHTLPTLSQLSFGEWAIFLFILFNIWLWKYHYKHPALEVLWRYFSYAYKVIALAFVIKYVDDKFFRNKKIDRD